MSSDILTNSLHFLVYSPCQSHTAPQTLYLQSGKAWQSFADIRRVAVILLSWHWCGPEQWLKESDNIFPIVKERNVFNFLYSLNKFSIIGLFRLKLINRVHWYCFLQLRVIKACKVKWIYHVRYKKCRQEVYVNIAFCIPIYLHTAIIQSLEMKQVEFILMILIFYCTYFFRINTYFE